MRRGKTGTIRHLLAAAVLSACTLTAIPALAEFKGLEIIAPANSGGGYDQHARALQQVMQELNLASGVQVMNVPGAGGTIGLSQFVTARKRNPSLMIGGLGMIGAIQINKAPVTLDQVMPLALLTGEYQPLVVAADSPIKSLQDLIDKFKADPGSVSWGGFAVGSPDHILSGLVVKAVGGDVGKMNYIASGAGGELMAALLGNHITVGTGGYNEFASQLQAGKLRAIGISAPERLPGLDIPTFKEQGWMSSSSTGAPSLPSGLEAGGEEAARRGHGQGHGQPSVEGNLPAAWLDQPLSARRPVRRFSEG